MKWIQHFITAEELALIRSLDLTELWQARRDESLLCTSLKQSGIIRLDGTRPQKSVESTIERHQSLSGNDEAGVGSSEVGEIRAASLSLPLKDRPLGFFRTRLGISCW